MISDQSSIVQSICCISASYACTTCPFFVFVLSSHNRIPMQDAIFVDGCNIAKLSPSLLFTMDNSTITSFFNTSSITVFTLSGVTPCAAATAFFSSSFNITVSQQDIRYVLSSSPIKNAYPVLITSFAPLSAQYISRIDAIPFFSSYLPGASTFPASVAVASAPAGSPSSISAARTFP